jgi:hypothetical protein
VAGKLSCFVTVCGRPSVAISPCSWPASTSSAILRRARLPPKRPGPVNRLREARIRSYVIAQGEKWAAVCGAIAGSGS